LPLTFRLISSSGAEITVELTSIVGGSVVDTGSQYGAPATSAPTSAPTHAATSAPTSAPTHSATSAPTSAPTHAPTTAPTHAPTTAPTTAPTHAPTTAPTHAPTTAPTTAPTHAPTTAPTHAPTTAPTTAPTHAPTTAPTHAPTSAPTTAPTHAPTTAPTHAATSAPTPAGSENLCAVTPTSSEPLKLLVPLYEYPDSNWDLLIDAASQVGIIAIINPNSGPGSSVDSSYTSYMQKFRTAGIEMVGYVHTSYGARAISDVEADISSWASFYPGYLSGIFLDEASDSASEISYYTQVYNYVLSKSGYVNSILNPGVIPDSGYLSISSSIVIFEDTAAALSTSALTASWVQCASSSSAKSGFKYKFSGIVNTASSSQQAGILSTLNAAGVGLVFVTDGANGCCTYNTLTSYFTQEAASVDALN